MLVAGITLIIVALLFSASEKKFSRFSNTFMVSGMLKILLLLVIIVVYSYTNPDAAIKAVKMVRLRINRFSNSFIKGSSGIYVL